MNHNGGTASLSPIPDAYCALDSEWRFLELDRAAEEHFGRPARELIGRDFWAETRIEPDSAISARFREAVIHQQRVRFETESTLRAGLWLEVHAHPRPTGGLDVYFHEVTTRKQAEQALRLSEESFSKTFQAAAAAMALTRMEDGRILDVNDRWLELMECSRDEVIGKTATEYGGWKDPAERQAIVGNLQTHGFVRDRECAITSQRGREWTAMFSARTVTIRGEKVLISSAIDITERKRAEETLRQLNGELERRVAERTAELHAASRYARSLIEASLDPLVTINADGKITDVNEASVRAVGVPREKLIGTDFSEYFTEPDKAREGYQRVFAEGFARDYPLAIRHLSGRVSEVLYNATVYRNEAGEVQGVFAAARDVTERKRAEETVNVERRRLFQVLERLPAMICLLAPDRSVTFANRAFRERFGEADGRHCFEQRFGLSAPCAFCESFKVLETGKPHQWEVTAPDGAWVISAHDYPFTDSDGSPVVLEMGIDITEHRRAEAALKELTATLEQRVADRTAALRQSEERFRLALKNSPVVVAIQDCDLVYRWVYNNTTRRPEEAVGRTDADLFAAEDLPSILEVKRKVLQTGQEARCAQWLTSNGQRVYLDCAYEPIRDLAGRTIGVGIAAVNLTEQKKAEEALRRSQAETRTLLENTPAGLVLFEAKRPYKVLAHNRYYQELFAEPFRSRGMAGLNIFEYAPAVEAEGVVAVFDEVVRTMKPNSFLDFPYRSNPPQQSWFNWHISPLILDGQVVALLSMSLDVTEHHLADDALREANARLAELDRRKDEFIAVLSHELRNPLAPIQFALPALRSACSGQPTGVQAIGIIERQTAQLRRLIDDLLEVSRVATGKLELRRDTVTLALVTRIAVEAAAPSIAAGRHSLKMAVPEEPLWVFGDAARLSQVVMNLLDNAAKYTPPGGQLELTVARENNEGVLRVRDNGKGIPAEALKTIFEMFHQVSEHDRHGGLGIGLSLAQKLVEMHGGRIEARSDGAGYGAEFTVRLPLATPADEQVPRGPDDARATGGRRLKVLIVDDNFDLVEMLAAFVNSFGHDVQKAFDGPSAVSAALVYRPDVVLLDLGLPGMTGLDVARELRRHSETAAAYLVALTGWGRADDMQRTQAAGFNMHLTKPAEPETVQHLLEVIASGSPS